jgi:hypothetical protein
MWEIAYLSSRRWDIELAFKLLKCQLGLHIWWGACPEMVLIQLWLALILAQLLHARPLHVALQAQVEPVEISMQLLIELLPVVPTDSTPIVERLVQHGRDLALIRPSSRIQILVPEPQPPWPARPAPKKADIRHARYAQRNPHPRTAPFVSHFLTQLLI